MKTNREIFEESNKKILDCFTGADGGGRYLKYLSIMRDFSDQADDGNVPSEQLVDIVKKFSNLIDILNR